MPDKIARELLMGHALDAMRTAATAPTRALRTVQLLRCQMYAAAALGHWASVDAREGWPLASDGECR